MTKKLINDEKIDSEYEFYLNYSIE